MANQTFTDAPINGKKFATLPKLPKAPTSKISNVFGNKPDLNELGEILFQAKNVMRNENPSLSFLDEDEHAQAPPNTPTEDVELVTHAKDPRSKDKITKRREANRVYGARCRAKKLAKVKELIRQNDDMKMKVAMMQSQVAGFACTCTWLNEENRKMKAYCDIMGQRSAHLEAANQALIQEIHWLRSINMYYYF